MPELNPGLPQVEAQGGIGAVSPNLEAVSEAGRGVERFGNDLAQTGEVFERRNQQSEVSSGYSGVAGLREQGLDDLQESARTGELDVDEYKQQLSDKFGKLEDSLGLQTQVGQNYFNRQQARAQGYLLQKAVHLKAQLTANQTVGDIQDAVTSMSNVAMKDPAQFTDLIDSNEDTIQAHVDTGALPANMADKFRKEMNAKIADGAAKGWAQMDPGKDADGKPNPNLLTQMLAHRDENGKGPFDDYLDADHISTLENYARTQDSWREIAGKQKTKAEDDAYNTTATAYMDSIANRVLKGSYSMRELENSPLNYQDKMHVASQLDTWANKEAKVDSRAANQLTRDIYDHKITNMDQLFERAKEQNLPYPVVERARSLINMTPEGQRLNYDRKRIFDMMQSAGGGIVFKDATGQDSPVGQANAKNAHDAVLDLEQQYHQQGRPLNELYDLKNPDLQNVFQKFGATRQQMNGASARQSVNDALGIKAPSNPGTITYSTSPTGQIPTPVAPNNPNNPYARRPGETPSQTLERIKKLRAGPNG